MLEIELMHIVFVHYLEVKGSRTSIGMKENNSNSLSGTASVNIDSAASPTSRLSSYCEDADSGDSHQSSSVLRASPEPQTGNRNGWTSAPGMRIASQVLGNRVGETDSQRSFDVQAWDAVENLVTRYDQPCNNLLVEERTNKFGMLPAEHLRSPLQNQLNWQIPAQDDLPLPKWPGYLVPHSGMTDDTDLALFGQSAQDNFESFSSLLDIEHLQSDGIPPSDMESEYIPVKKSLLRHEDSLKKVDSFSRWASKELGEMEDLQMQSSRGDIAWASVDCETAAAGLSFSPSLSEDQRFTIVDYWPKCAQTDADVEVLVIGTFLLNPQEVTICSWSCMFGEVEVPAEILVDGVLCCHAPPHTAGQVPFYVTCSNRFACSELREFDFLSGSTKKIDAAGIYGYSTKEASLQMRFEELLAHRAFVQEHQIFEDVVEKRRKISKIMLLNEEKENLFPGIYERDSTKQEPKERVLRKQFEDELYIWLIHKVTEEGKGPNILDEGGQGVLHFVAALGYDWAIKPILAAGVNINFRDANGWSALHWAAFSGREETVAVLVSLGADAGALTDPSPELPLGKTAADLAYGKEHRGISGFLAESSLTSYLEKLTMESKENSPANSGGPKAVQTVSERTAAPMSYGDVPETLSLKDSLTAVRNATQAADRLHLGGTTTTAATSAAPPPSNDSAAAAAAATVGAFEVSEEMNDRGFGGNRWPRQETLALLKIRSDMGIAFRDASVKGPLWEEVSRKMAELGYIRNAKKCKEKFENVYKYHKRTKEGRTGKSEGKTYRFFDQLEALETRPTSSSIHHQQQQQPPPQTQPQPLQPQPPLRPHNNNSPMFSTSPPVTTITPQITNTTFPPYTQPANVPSFPNISGDFLSDNSTSSSRSTSSDVDAGDGTTTTRKKKRKRKWKEFFERLTRQVVDKQEELQRKFLEAVEKREDERLVREESWRVQEIARINRERDILAQERSMSAAKDAAVMAFLQKLSEKPNPQGQSIIPQPQPQPQQAPSQMQVNNNNNQQTPQPPPPPPTQPTQPVTPTVDTSKTDNGDQNMTPVSASAAGAVSSSRWPKVEIEALIKLRTNLDSKYQENGPKGPLWEEISAGMKRLGFNRNSKRCKEKWENINKYFKKVKESNKKRPEDSKTCPYFHQLDALYRERNKFHTNNNVIASSSSTSGLVKPDNSVPLMVQPEQQWPPAMATTTVTSTVAATAQPDQHPPPQPLDKNFDDEEGTDGEEYDDEEDYEENEEEEGGEFELMPSNNNNNKPTNNM